MTTRRVLIRSLLIAAVLLLAVPGVLWAHPGVGIVVDRRGNVYYTDLVHVWRIAPDGRKSIVVRDVHSHELAIDSAGNVFGEDNRYQGGDRYRNRVWRRSPDGRVTDVVPWREGFWREYGFVRDRDGAMYWAACPERICTIRRRTPDGRTSTVAPGARYNHPINWIAAGRAGVLYVVDGADLRQIDRAGELSTLARALGGAPMGLWPEAGGTVLVAVYGARAVVRVAADGRVTTVARTPAPWGPAGVTRAPNGDLWILEWSATNEARVRRVAARGRTTVY